MRQESIVPGKLVRRESGANQVMEQLLLARHDATNAIRLEFGIGTCRDLGTKVGQRSA
jgi:hypothetical protein